LLRVAKQLRKRGVGSHKTAVRRDDDHAHARVAEDPTKFFFALSEAFLGTLPLGDVLKRPTKVSDPPTRIAPHFPSQTAPPSGSVWACYLEIQFVLRPGSQRLLNHTL
jgi:hypothetical protein